MSKNINWRTKRNIASALVLVLSILFFWIAGMDFNQRSPWVALAIFASLWAAVMCWTYPEWRYDENGRRMP